jgi:dihydrodipicolinate synthase/N-acetylneuraminate lyase
MNDRERIKAVETVRASASEGKTIVAGTGMQATRATVEFTNLAADAGADYALVVTPFGSRCRCRLRPGSDPILF